MVAAVHGVKVSAQFNFFETRNHCPFHLAANYIYFAQILAVVGLCERHKSFYVDAVVRECECAIKVMNREKKRERREWNKFYGFRLFTDIQNGNSVGAGGVGVGGGGGVWSTRNVSGF